MMLIVTLDISDSLGFIDVVVGTRLEAERLREFMKDAKSAIDAEHARVAADVAYNRAKNNGSLLAAEIERARIDELKWSET
jgi:hypothetical protein